MGANVSAHYRSKSAALEALALEYSHDRITCLQGELTKEDVVARVFAEAEAAFGPIQIVVINHGYYLNDYVPIVDMGLDQWNSTIATDLTSPFLVAREFLRNLTKAGEDTKEKAAIVLVGSTAGKYGEQGHADYAASKSGPYRSIISISTQMYWLLTNISVFSYHVWSYFIAEERDCEDCAEGPCQLHSARLGQYSNGSRRYERSRYSL